MTIKVESLLAKVSRVVKLSFELLLSLNCIVSFSFVLTYVYFYDKYLHQLHKFILSFISGPCWNDIWLQV